MTLYLVAVAVLALGGLAAFAASARPGLALRIGSATAALGSALGLVASLGALGGGVPTLDLPWPVPYGALALGLDPLSAWFAVTIFALGLPAAVFGAGYLRDHPRQRSLGAFSLFFGLLLASMALLVAARQALLFLVAWEGMTVASFLLVAFEHEDRAVRDAARTYVVASHLGTAFLMAMFLVLGRAAGGSLRFEAFAQLRGDAALPASALFGCAVLGFGTKAGLVPLHVWLPEAHPAAPSHVSAVMSGVLVNMGLYGLVRVLGFLPPAPLAWGAALAAIGLVGAVVALALALGQRDLKRVLAYSTVENVGIVALGLGLGLSGAALGSPVVAALGVAGALLHVWNHSLMKGLAFLGAGAVVHGTGTRDVERMGGLLARMPRVGGLLVLAAAALAGLPPLAGFVSEWLLYLGLAAGAGYAPGAVGLAASLALAALALVGALAAVVFARLLGVALLGAPRSPEAAHAHDGGPLLVAPLAALAAAVIAVAALPERAVALAVPAVAAVLGAPAREVSAALAGPAATLGGPMRLGVVVLVAAAAGLALWARRLRAARDVRASSTWGCGFSAESARVQYTAASFAELPLRAVVPTALRPRVRVAPPAGLFPGAVALATDGDDPARARLFEPAFAWLGDRMSRLRRFQQARLNLQLLYTVATVIALSLLLLLYERKP